MATDRKVIMPDINPKLQEFEKYWNDAEKTLIRGTITNEALNFLEEQAFKDFGMMKKGAIGIELTRLILIARDSMENKESQ
jgi:hypothetical protein